MQSDEILGITLYGKGLTLYTSEVGAPVMESDNVEYSTCRSTA